MDCRYHLKATFNVYGSKDFTCDMSCNWDGDYGEIDSRISEFFLNSYAKAKAQYDDRMAEFHREADEQRLKKSELTELKRLKEKYPDAQ
jgi:hypothetical protein